MNAVKLVLSGSSMSGFYCVVPRTVLTTATPDTLIDMLKIQLLDYISARDMWQLKEEVERLKLHIHAPYTAESNIIYICKCTQEYKNDI